MNESLEYEKMIEFPLASCEYVHKRRRLFKKRKLIKEVNSKIEGALADNCYDCAEKDLCENANFGSALISSDQNLKADSSENAANFSKGNIDRDYSESSSVEVGVGGFNEDTSDKKSARAFWKSIKNPEKRQDKIIAVQLAAVFLLAAAIILTNVFWENSGMNTLFKSVFGSSQTQTDNRVYSDFSLNLPVRGEGLTYTEGVINVSGESFIYPVCEGKISKIEKSSDGKYTVTVNHSDTFKSVVTGADFVCFSEGESVNAKIPLCHTEQGASVYLYDDEKLITEYAAKENSIVWNK